MSESGDLLIRPSEYDQEECEQESTAGHSRPPGITSISLVDLGLLPADRLSQIERSPRLLVIATSVMPHNVTETDARELMASPVEQKHRHTR